MPRTRATPCGLAVCDPRRYLALAGGERRRRLVAVELADRQCVDGMADLGQHLLVRAHEGRQASPVAGAVSRLPQTPSDASQSNMSALRSASS